MPDVRNQRDITQLIQILPYVTPTSVVPANTAMTKFLAATNPIVIPKIRKVDDAIMVGDGQRFKRNSFNYYAEPRSFPIGGLLNDHVAAMLLHRNAGGAVTPTALTGAGNDFAIVQNVANSTPLLFNVGRFNGVERFMHQDCFCDTYEITQDHENQPTFSAGVRNAGKFHYDELAAFAEGNAVAIPSYKYFHGGYTAFQFTVNGVTYNLPSEGRLLSLGITLSQNIIIKPLPGDDFIDSANKTQGMMAKFAYIQTQTAVMRIKAYPGTTNLPEFKALLSGQEVSAATAVFRDTASINAGGQVTEFEVKFPKGEIEDFDGDTEDEHNAVSIQIGAKLDLVSGGLYTGRIRTLKTALSLGFAAS